MNTCPICGQTCEWKEDLQGYRCGRCSAWFRVTKDDNGDPLLDMSVTNRAWSEIQDKVGPWWAKLNEEWAKG